MRRYLFTALIKVLEDLPDSLFCADKWSTGMEDYDEIECEAALTDLDDGVTADGLVWASLESEFKEAGLTIVDGWPHYTIDPEDGPAAMEPRDLQYLFDITKDQAEELFGNACLEQNNVKRERTRLEKIEQYEKFLRDNPAR